MIKYLGSKRLLVPRIVEIVRSLPRVRTVLDLFSGTARVGHALKSAGFRVTANDHLAYAETLARCYVAADARKVGAKVERLLAELRRVRPKAGYFTETFCVASRFFRPKNGARIDAMRDRIARWEIEDRNLEAVLLVSLMEAADRVDSTTGVQMAYLKSWAPRAQNDLVLRLPEILSGPGRALGLEAADAARRVKCDLAYLDPPYNQHKYLGNYHIWETLVRWDRPEAYGVARKRIDCRDRRSDFNSKPGILPALSEVLSNLRARFALVSFNNEGYVPREEMERLLVAWAGSRRRVRTIEVDHPRYVGARIGIYNPSGVKVGRVSHTRNKEYLFLAG